MSGMTQQRPRRTQPPARKPPEPRSKLGSPDRRMRIVAGLCVVVMAIFGVQLVRIQGLDTMALAQKALQNRLVTKTLPADRGQITAADGTVLAETVNRYRLVVDQENVQGYKAEDGTVLGASGAAEAMAPLLDTTAEALLPDIEGRKRWNVITTGLTAEAWRAVQELAIPGVSAEAYPIRSYPAGAVAGNMLGFTGSDGAALSGLELAYDSSLTGRDGEQQYERSRDGDVIPLGDSNMRPPVDGQGLKLSLDPDIQYNAQKQIAAQVRKNRAEWGSVVVLDTRTQRILAAADAPSVNPNNPGATSADNRGSRIFEASIEPGSTAKAITAAALLEEKKSTPGSKFTVPYRWEAPNGESFRDSSPHPTQKLTLAGVMAESSNTGTLQAGDDLSLEQRYDYFRKFGFGQTSGVGYPGESAGILRKSDQWDGRTQLAVMFGQGLAATSLQSASAFATIANGGVRVPPSIVEGTIAPDGSTTPVDPPSGERVVSEKTSAEMRRILEGVVSDGTGSAAAVPGYRVGGKTGTAQAPSEKGGGYDGYTASFIGIAPIEDPRIVVAVVLQRPRNGYYGGTAAGPVFQNVTSYALRHLGVPPSTKKPDPYPLEWKD